MPPWLRGGGATRRCPGSSSMAAGRGGLQLEEPSSRRAGLAGGEARRAQERRPRGRRAGRRPPEAGRWRGGPGCRGRPDGRGDGARSGEATGLASRPAAAQRWEWECGTGRAGEGDLGFHFHRVEAGLLGRLDLSVGSLRLASWLDKRPSQNFGLARLYFSTSRAEPSH